MQVNISGANIENDGIIAAGAGVDLATNRKITNRSLIYSDGSMNLYFDELLNDEDISNNNDEAIILARDDIVMQKNSSDAR